jgi:hypothetical protein
MDQQGSNSLSRGECESVLDCFLNFSAPEASGADANPSGRTIDHCANSLKVWIECALGLVVRVTDVMTRLVLLGANITCKRHDDTPSLATDMDDIDRKMYHSGIQNNKVKKRLFLE